MSEFIKKPCQHCPYRKDVKPFLTPERGTELAFNAAFHHKKFHCHKTVDYSNNSDGAITKKTQLCAGFLSLQHNETGSTAYDDEGFEPSDLVYSSSREMAIAYCDANA